MTRIDLGTVMSLKPAGWRVINIGRSQDGDRCWDIEKNAFVSLDPEEFDWPCESFFCLIREARFEIDTFISGSCRLMIGRKANGHFTATIVSGINDGPQAEGATVDGVIKLLLAKLNVAGVNSFEKMIELYNLK